jgi:putative transposase
MRKARFTEEQMVAILQEQATGIHVDALCRKHNINKQTFYRWRQKYGGMQSADVKRLKQLEDENTRLKRMVANLSLENDAMKEVIKKKY